jgi:hypothetical protein
LKKELKEKKKDEKRNKVNWNTTSTEHYQTTKTQYVNPDSTTETEECSTAESVVDIVSYSTSTIFLNVKRIWCFLTR